METGLTIGEQQAYDMLFNRHLSAAETSRLLQAKGIVISSVQLRKFKKDVFNRLMTVEKVERMSELMLESVDRIKFEFEELNIQTKRLLQRAIDEDKPRDQLVILREIKDQLIIGLKYLGEFKGNATKINAKNVNILSQGDIMETFKKMQSTWFSEMGARLENGKLIFDNPTPELIDEFNRWQATQYLEAEVVAEKE